jgi:hypothetical protein
MSRFGLARLEEDGYNLSKADIFLKKMSVLLLANASLAQYNKGNNIYEERHAEKTF